MVRPFEYEEPASLPEALRSIAAGGPDVHVLAGGTALVLLIQQGLVQPAKVVSLRAVPGLGGIARQPDGGIHIGAMTTHREIAASPELRGYAPALTDGFDGIATVRIRNVGTVGGNLAHADPAQDPPVLLLALGASVELVSSDGARIEPLDDLFVDYLETSIRPGELLTRVMLPALDATGSLAYVKLKPRSADDYPTVSVAALVARHPNGSMAAVRIALGGAGTTTLRARDAEDACLGRRPEADVIEEAGRLAAASTAPLADHRGSIRYKRAMVEVMVARALGAAVEGRPS